MLTWMPDFCLSGNCRIELDKAVGKVDWTRPKSFVTLCPHHRGLKDSGLTDQQVFDAILQSSRVKEAARWAVKVELGLDKEHPGVPYRINADGSFTVLTDSASLAWEKDGQPGPLPTIRGVDRNRARTAALSAVSATSRPIGTSTVTVE